MKSTLFWAALALPLLLAAQTPQAGDRPTYRATLSIGKYQRPSGYLMALNDSSIVLAKKPQLPAEMWQAFPVREVERVRVWEKGSPGRYALDGAVVGLAVTTLIGLHQGNLPWAPSWFGKRNKIIISGMILIPTSSLIGLIVGDSQQKKFRIGGSATEYARQREKLEQYRYGQ
jgi:hypothetical protein